jgi:hypothetical protein
MAISMEEQVTVRLREEFTTSFKAFGRHVVAFIILSAVAHIPLFLWYFEIIHYPGFVSFFWGVEVADFLV